MRGLPSRVFQGGVIAFLGCFLASAARADEGDVIAAEALFRSGKDLLAQKDYAHACPKLGESYRLDAASGTLLALAICHEREGKLASAWGEYSDVASRSKVESRPDREMAARGKAAELQAELSTLTIVAPDATAVTGFEVKRNGTVIAPAWFGTAVPVDGGTVSIDASAPGKKARHIDITLAPSGDRQTVTLLPLDDARTEPPLALPPVGPASSGASVRPSAIPDAAFSTPSEAAAPRPGLAPLALTGLIAGACGVVSLGVGAFFTLRAIDQNNASHNECEGDLCTAAGRQDRNDARSSGDIATATLLGGGVLVAAGAALLLFGRGSREGSAADGRTSLRLLPSGGDHGIGGLLQGTF
jgi:hypothetical protein